MGTNHQAALGNDIPAGPRQQLLQLVALTNLQLRRVDPLLMNLLVAKGIPRLADLDISYYQDLRDQWARAIRRETRRRESKFHAAPHQWHNDIHFFRLGLLAWYVDEVLEVRYREDHKATGR